MRTSPTFTMPAISRLAWDSPGRPAAAPRTRVQKLCLRGGFGIFYDRFPLSYSLAAERYNGIVQQQYVVTNPDSVPGFPAFPNVPSLSALAAFQSQQVIQQVSPSLRSPYVLQTAATLERQLPKSTTLALTYTNSRGFRELLSEDRNAPLPGTYNPATPGSGVFPLGHPGAVFCDGVFRCIPAESVAGECQLESEPHHFAVRHLCPKPSHEQYRRRRHVPGESLQFCG